MVNQIKFVINYFQITNPFKLEMLAKSQGISMFNDSTSNLDPKIIENHPLPNATATNLDYNSNLNYSFDGYQQQKNSSLEKVTNAMSLYDDNVPRPKPDRITKETFTIEQQRQLFEEPLGTDNAMVAVMGYNPTDDARICPHFDPKTDACFKVMIFFVF
jgi:hypothetical protein